MSQKKYVVVHIEADRMSIQQQISIYLNRFLEMLNVPEKFVMILTSISDQLLDGRHIDGQLCLSGPLFLQPNTRCLGVERGKENLPF